MRRALLEMSEDPEGRSFLDGLRLDGFGEFETSLFDSIRQMADDTRKALLWIDSADARTLVRP